ncbi:unnamed protein product [Closterium sp. NIES-53]
MSEGQLLLQPNIKTLFLYHPFTFLPRRLTSHPHPHNQVAASSDVIFIAVKPFAVQPVLADLAASGALTERHLIVSIAAGVPLGKMQQWAGEGVRIVRVMPNTPCLVGATAAGERDERSGSPLPLLPPRCSRHTGVVPIMRCLGERAAEQGGELVSAMFFEAPPLSPFYSPVLPPSYFPHPAMSLGESATEQDGELVSAMFVEAPPLSPPYSPLFPPMPAMSLGESATEEDGALVRAMFGAVGEVYEVEERLLDAVTGLSGSGPAYVFVAIEALADGGTAAGLPRKVALSLAAQTVYGAAKMVIDTQKHPAQLKDSVASPAGIFFDHHSSTPLSLQCFQPTLSLSPAPPLTAVHSPTQHHHSVPATLGTTIAGLLELGRGGFGSLLMNAVVAAANRRSALTLYPLTHPPTHPLTHSPTPTPTPTRLSHFDHHAGTTIAGLHELERGGFRSLLMNAVVAAANRSKELSN